jgi:hypothetical protein
VNSDNDNKSVISNKSKKELKLEKERMARHRKLQKKIRGFMDEEAELGSDNEENDDRRKVINEEDEDEEDDEDEMDDDLDGFVVHGADNEEIEEANEAMHEKHMKDMLELEKQ